MFESSAVSSLSLCWFVVFWLPTPTAQASSVCAPGEGLSGRPHVPQEGAKAGVVGARSSHVVM